MVKKIITLMFMVLFYSSLAIAAETSSSSEAKKVFVKDRNIYYERDGKTTQLTSSGRDEEPVLHPEEEWVYFVRRTPGAWKGEEYYPAKDEIVKNGILADELWRVKIDGTHPKLLFRNDKIAVDGPNPDYRSAIIQNIQFSPDGDKVYFETPNWVTSSGLNIMNADGSGQKLLGGANGAKIVISARELDPKHGTCRGYIVASQHRYWWFGGSYDWYYLFTPDFKEVGPLGDDFDYFTEMGDIVYTDHSEKEIKRSYDTKVEKLELSAKMASKI